MSPLTKLFVVLLVLTSTLLTAGVVTFVNKLDPIQKNLDLTKAQLADKQALLDQRGNELATAQAQYQAEVQAHADEVAGLKKDALKAQSDLGSRDAQIATLNSNLAVLTAANNSQSAAVAASEDAKAKLSEQVVALRKDADQRLSQIADLGQRVNKLVADLDQTEKARRNLAEQLTEVKGTADKQAAMIKDLGGNPALLSNAGTQAGAPNINGVIRSRRTIAGKEYATISIGSQDYVTKGMQFKILDKNTGQFLGMLQIEVIDTNEAMGQITADPGALAQIKAGDVIKTQI